jgi:hypothetical protein
MEKKHWEICPFHESRQCPQKARVDRRLSRLPFRSSIEIEAATTTCQTCEKRLRARQRYPRINGPLNGVLLTEEEAPAEVDILDLSEGDALIRLKDWVRLHKDDKVCLVIYFPRETPSQSSPKPVRQHGFIERIQSAKWELAIAFLNEPEQ